MPGAKPSTSPDAISPLHDRPRLLSTVQAFGPPALRLGLSVTPPFGLGVPHELCLRRPTMPFADFCEVVREDCSALSPSKDTSQISRGKLSDLPCIDAGFIKHSPLVDGGLCCCVPARPGCTTPRIRFVSLAPHVRSTLPSDPTSRGRPGASLVLRLHAHLDGGLAPPRMTACTAHTLRFSGGPRSGPSV